MQVSWQFHRHGGNSSFYKLDTYQPTDTPPMTSCITTLNFVFGVIMTYRAMMFMYNSLHTLVILLTPEKSMNHKDQCLISQHSAINIGWDTKNSTITFDKR